jgi:hypothetical protein
MTCIVFFAISTCGLHNCNHLVIYNLKLFSKENRKINWIIGAQNEWLNYPEYGPCLIPGACFDLEEKIRSLIIFFIVFN